MNSWARASEIAGEYSAGFQTTALPQGKRRDHVPRGDGDGEIARGDYRGDADRHPEGEELLVRHLRGDRLPVETASLAGKEVAGVYDLLHLAQSLRVGLPDLAGNKASQGFLVVLDYASYLLDETGPDRGRDRGPLPLRLASGPTGRHKSARVAEEDLGDRLVGPRGVNRAEGPSWRVFERPAPDDGGDGSGGGRGRVLCVFGAH
jgi:hypothetical protein